MDRSLSHQVPECYQTGSTQPPKSHNSLIAILLVLVILLSGIVSVLGLMNIHLFRTLMNRQEEDDALAFESAPSEAPLALGQYAPASVGGRTAIGISGQDISPFHADFYQVPQGIYVTDVISESDAFAQGLRPQDIILAFDGNRTTDCTSLKALLDARLPGDRVSLTVYRKGSQLELTITLFEDVE